MKKRYWLRGGIIGLIIFGALIALTILAPKTSDMGNLPAWVLLFIAFPLWGWGDGPFHFQFSFGPFSFASFDIFLIMYFFVFGSILGWIYGKIKNRNKII